MTLQTLNRYRLWPGNFQLSGVPALAAGNVMSAAGHYEGGAFQAPKDLTVSHVAFKPQAVSGSPHENVRIEDLDASGFPSGNLLAAGANVAGATVLTTSWLTHTLGTPVSIPMGTWFFLKLGYQDGTSWTHTSLSNFLGATSVPYRVANTGTPTKGTLLNRCMILGSSASSFYHIPNLWPISAVSATTFTSATNPDRRGMRFKCPFKSRLVAVRFYGGAEVGNCTIAVWTDAGVIIGSGTAIPGANSSGAAAGSPYDVVFNSPVEIVAGTSYMVTVEATSATPVGFATYTVPSSNYMGATPGGPDCHYIFSNDGGAFDQSNTLIVPFMDLILDQQDDGINAAGGKGLLV